MQTQVIRHPSTWVSTQRNNKLPYTMNSTLDIQWQPRNDLAIDIGYVNALGRHEIIPIPFNQAQDCLPDEPTVRAGCQYAPTRAVRRLLSPTPMAIRCRGSRLRCATFANSCPGNLPNGQPCSSRIRRRQRRPARSLHWVRGRVGAYTAEGFGLQRVAGARRKEAQPRASGGVSYTFSRSFDEQSALGLFYNGNNPLNLRGGYGAVGL